MGKTTLNSVASNKSKAKHSKQLARKKNKIKADKQQHKARLKAIVQKRMKMSCKLFLVAVFSKSLTLK